MAEMWPKELPDYVLNDRDRKVECGVYQRFKSVLDDDYLVLYSVPYQVEEKTTGKVEDGECDFVVAHAKYGILFVEIKGGTISYDRDYNRWTTTNSLGTYEIKDPIGQAKDAHYKLGMILKQDKLLKTRHMNWQHAAIFPGTEVGRGRLAAHVPEGMICGRSEFHDDAGLRSWVRGGWRLESGCWAETACGQSNVRWCQNSC